MATSDVLKVPRFIRSTITLPREEMSYALDPKKSVQLASMEVDGLDPTGHHLPASDVADIWTRTKGPCQVFEVKDLQLVTKWRSVTAPYLERIKAWRGKCLLFIAEVHAYHHHNSGRGERHDPPHHRRKRSSCTGNPNSFPRERKVREEGLHQSPILLAQYHDCPILQPREM